MTINFFKTFGKKANPENARLSAAHDGEISDMADLVSGACSKDGIGIGGRMPDDSHTGVSAAIIASLGDHNPEHAARMAWANKDLGI